MKPIETTFKRIETKYVVSKEILDKLIQDLKEYLVEDDYPISTISNIYFDTEDFDILQDEHLGDKRKEKVQEVIQSALDQFCSEVDMITINSTNAGESLSIVYEVELKSDTYDFQVASYLTRNIAECDVALTKKAKKRKNL